MDRKENVTPSDYSKPPIYLSIIIELEQHVFSFLFLPDRICLLNAQDISAKGGIGFNYNPREYTREREQVYLLVGLSSSFFRLSVRLKAVSMRSELVRKHLGNRQWMIPLDTVVPQLLEIFFRVVSFGFGQTQILRRRQKRKLIDTRIRKGVICLIPLISSSAGPSSLYPRSYGHILMSYISTYYNILTILS